MKRERRQPTRHEWAEITSNRPVVRKIPPGKERAVKPHPRDKEERSGAHTCTICPPVVEDLDVRARRLSVEKEAYRVKRERKERISRAGRDEPVQITRCHAVGATPRKLPKGPLEARGRKKAGWRVAAIPSDQRVPRSSREPQDRGRR